MREKTNEVTELLASFRDEAIKRYGKRAWQARLAREARLPVKTVRTFFYRSQRPSAGTVEAIRRALEMSDVDSANREAGHFVPGADLQLKRLVHEVELIYRSGNRVLLTALRGNLRAFLLVLQETEKKDMEQD